MKKIVPFTCPRCGLTTFQKGDMRKHLNRKTPCQCVHESQLQLTDEIKEIILRDRVYHVPKGTHLELCIRTKNARALEKKVITLFKSKYSQKKEYGNEYFNGDLPSMIVDISVLSQDMYRNRG
jgi:hypothetical protein